MRMGEWQKYVETVVRLYPERVKVYDTLSEETKREVNAVTAALRLFDLEANGKELYHRMVKERYWGKSKRTRDQIAMDLYSSLSTIKRWDKKFLCNVAALLGLYKDGDSPIGSGNQ